MDEKFSGLWGGEARRQWHRETTRGWCASVAGCGRARTGYGWLEGVGEEGYYPHRAVDHTRTITASRSRRGRAPDELCGRKHSSVSAMVGRNDGRALVVGSALGVYARRVRATWFCGGHLIGVAWLCGVMARYSAPLARRFPIYYIVNLMELVSHPPLTPPPLPLAKSPRGMAPYINIYIYSPRRLTFRNGPAAAANISMYVYAGYCNNCRRNVKSENTMSSFPTCLESKNKLVIN